MNQYKFCHIEQLSNGLWYIMWPDCTKADHQGFKNKGSAQRALNFFTKDG